MSAREEVGDPRYHVEAADRTMQLLTAMAELAPVTVSGLTAALGWTKPMVYRLVRTLHACGALRQTDEGYSLGPQMIYLGQAALKGIRLTDVARPHLATLHEAVEETVVLTVLDRTDIVYVDFIETEHLILARTRLGARLPASSTSSGHALLSRHGEERIRALFKNHEFTGPTGRAVRSVEDLLDRVERVRRLGYALIDEELAAGHRAAAAPVLDHAGRVVAAISISVPASRVSVARLRKMAENHLVPVTFAVSTALGHLPARPVS
ncbi:IclR family transcriptional regulator [Sphaerisporangium rufum]|uniref:IclR family transcriptional regulator n=1 Tax=Sphaerisporangium rufum TaxID=1381558 RepID=A0A919R2G8_9ACTN|nr:IclR family transcriptional regulator [Sphaerisporangium rufum]GII78501.1 IclR family transcriptional regulator [Sphaerisporangium rufum]